MKAVAISEDRRLEMVQLEQRSPGPGEASVEVAFCGICGSDLHLRPSQAVPVGSVMGHEFSGRVTQLGAGVQQFAPGDRVTVFPFATTTSASSPRRRGWGSAPIPADMPSPLWSKRRC